MNEEQKKKIAVIGDSEFTLGFRLAGVKKIYDKENFNQKIEKILNSEEIGILIMNEKDRENLTKRKKQKVEKSVDPVVITLSEEAESERLNEKIKKAIGADITS
ncbi:MAG: V-type ATP synthase subunit F [Candidatus Nanohaloarchaea archaeon]